MDKAAGWNAYQRRRRAGALQTFNGPAADEFAGLSSALLALLGSASDRVLSFGGEDLLRFFDDFGPALGVEPISRVGLIKSAELATLLRNIEAQLSNQAREDEVSALDRQLAWLGETLSLDELDLQILGAFTRMRQFEPWRRLISAFPFGGAGHPKMVGLLLGLSPEAIEERLEPLSPLIRTGLVVDEHDGDFRAGRFMQRLARLRTTDPEVLNARMLPPAPPSSLVWEDFDHIGLLRDLASETVKSAASRGKGLNILLHGVPGTGKSEFARTLADHLGLSAIFAGLSDEEGSEPTRGERIAHLNVIRALTEGSRKHIIVVDEADDVLQLPREADRIHMSKLWLNRLVEGARAPTIWIVNSPENLGATVVRRMNLAIGFALPPRQVRARVLARHATRADITLDASEVRLVAALPVAPAVIASAVEAASLSDGSGKTIHAASESILKALGHDTSSALSAPSVYDPALANADIDLARLADQLAESEHRGWSMLLAGPSGTGKSAYARHLAERLGLEILERRGSDLLAPFVGETESRIAAAFTASREQNALLLIDEIDSFLFQRQGQQQSWERSMVNEMLRFMEHLKVPFIGTTNLANTLDDATRRRFVLHIEMKALSGNQATNLFERHFGDTGDAIALDLEGLTPGDFASVALRARVLGETRHRTLESWLCKEREARHCSPSAIGF